MKTLTDQDYMRAAKQLGCDEPAIRAVAEVESAGGGFLADGSVKVLFEGHVFWKYTRYPERFAQSHPSLCYPKWTRAHYARGANSDERGLRELQRLAQAMLLDRSAALMSASYGKFQIMGFNHLKCMYPDVELFYQAMRRDEAGHLDAFCHFIKSVGLVGALRRHEWAAFAKGYNGPAYRDNDYDGKLARAYKRFIEKAKAQV